MEFCGTILAPAQGLGEGVARGNVEVELLQRLPFVEQECGMVGELVTFSPSFTTC